jgi:P pilus assembly chaperone PapD
MKQILLGSLIASIGFIAHANPVPSPTRLYVPAGAKEAVVDIENDGPESEAYSLSIDKWRGNANGELVLTLTDEIRLDTRKIILKSHEHHSVHLIIGDLASGESDERTYRLIFQIIPTAKLNSSGITVGQIDMPIFVGGPANGEPPIIDNATIKYGHLHFTVNNPGGRTFRPDAISAVGLSEGGATIFSVSRMGWYVLPHSSIDYDVTIARDACQKLAEVRISLLPTRGSVAAIIKSKVPSCSDEQVKTGFAVPTPSYHSLPPSQ